MTLNVLFAVLRNTCSSIAMPYTVNPLQPADILHLAEIQWAALKGNPLTSALYPRGPTPALLTFTTVSYQRSFAFPSVTLLKATDDATGEIVGFAKWVLYDQNEEQRLHQSNRVEERLSQGSKRSSGWEKDVYLRPSLPPDCYGPLLERWGSVINKTRSMINGPRGHGCRTGLPCSLECYFASFAEKLWGGVSPTSKNFVLLTLRSSARHSSCAS